MLKRKRITADMARLNEEREAWSKRYGRCWSCGGTRMLETHELVRKSETSEWRHAANYIRLCRSCHEEAHGGFLTKGILLTLKLIMDPGAFDADWIRAHAIVKGTQCEPLPRQCRWFMRELV